MKTNIKLFEIGKCWVVFLSFLTHGEDVPHEKWSLLEHRMLSSLCLSNFYFQRRGHLMWMVVLCNYNKSMNDNELLGWLPQFFSFFSLIFSRPLSISNFFLSYLSFFVVLLLFLSNYCLNSQILFSLKMFIHQTIFCWVFTLVTILDTKIRGGNKTDIVLPS